MSSFSSVGALIPGRTFFNLSYSKKFNCDMGKLIPIMCDEVVPGDVFKIGNDFTIRFEPLISPVMEDIYARVLYFFVPYRLLKRDCLGDMNGAGSVNGDTFDWEDFLAQGKDGKTITQVLPRWIPTKNTKYSLWDYLGFPVGISPAGAYPLNFPREAYNFVWNEWFRNENIDDEVSLDNEDILNIRWNRDYFTAALPFQQKGTAPVLSGDILYEGSDDYYHPVNIFSTYNSGQQPLAVAVGGSSVATALVNGNKELYHVAAGTVSSNGGISPKDGASQVVYGGFNIAQLRLCVQTQKWLERNARAGTRYTELLRSHFGVSPTDARLDRPEYIGGSKTPIIVSEVLQTSASPLDGESGSPQGTMAGHGISIDRNYVAKYRVEEYGLILGLLCVAPKHGYGGQGINRQWLRRDRLDFYFPEFAHLSEQGIETAEIYATDSEANNTDLFGYIGRYDEMRHKQDMCCADFRAEYQDWTLNEFYETKPLLNSSFVEANVRKNIFAVRNFPGIKVNFGNVIHAYRPLPLIGEPGLVDHF